MPGWGHRPGASHAAGGDLGRFDAEEVGQPCGLAIADGQGGPALRRSKGSPAWPRTLIRRATAPIRSRTDVPLGRCARELLVRQAPVGALWAGEAIARSDAVGWRSLSDDELDELLRAERIVRVAFVDDTHPSVVPLGYVWVDRALWGTTRRGHKTELADASPRVGLTIDDSIGGIPHYWRSCVGAGRFETVALDQFLAKASPALNAAFPNNPESQLREWIDGLGDGSSVCWRIRPTSMTGRGPAVPPPS